MTDHRAELTVPDQPTVFAVMARASRAPSIHNTQPWRWEFDGGELRLFRDDERRLTATDPNGRQLMISCGAMLHHARTAFAAAGWHTDVDRFPPSAHPEQLATLTFRPWPDPPPGVRARAQAIEQRRTDRLPLHTPGDLVTLVRTARKLADPHDVTLAVLDETAPERLASAAEHSTALRHYDMPYQAELRWWTGHDQTPYGVPAHALASEEESSRVPAGRVFPPAGESSRRADLQDEAALLVLSTPGDTPYSWLHTGEAMSAILLECAAAGLSTCPLTHITEAPTTRQVVANLAGREGIPQVVIRVGVAPDAEHHEPTPRRTPAEFLTMTHP
ncbi:Acg family FMN-binding oxidoreductase [Nocardia shimofusensis]|uniref:Acg family FMN-binding oxidoreductase n=1 Tax=Nocardia shimofusensis TaxID=228596 RepID=UPI0008359A77|nr:nitroreductase family protein [Nocardia shimofusensis]